MHHMEGDIIWMGITEAKITDPIKISVTRLDSL